MARDIGSLAATAAPFVGAAVMSADEHVVNRAQGRQAGADDTDADFRHGPNTGFDIGPLADDIC